MAYYKTTNYRQATDHRQATTDPWTGLPLTHQLLTIDHRPTGTPTHRQATTDPPTTEHRPTDHIRTDPPTTDFKTVSLFILVTITFCVCY